MEYTGRVYQEINSLRAGSDHVSKVIVRRGFGIEVHTEDNDEGDEAIVGDGLGLLHRPSRPLHHIV